MTERTIDRATERADGMLPRRASGQPSGRMRWRLEPTTFDILVGLGVAAYAALWIWAGWLGR